MTEVDHSLDSLLSLDGEIIVISDRYWVKFEAKEVSSSKHRPHGVKYSLTLHHKSGERIIGYDNAHKIPGNIGDAAYDHKHHVNHKNRIKEYQYQTAGKLLTDFWHDVDKIVNEE